MKLTEVVGKYIVFKRSLGMRFRSEATVLKAFCRAMGDIDIAIVEADRVLTYIAGTGPITIFWHRKFDTLKGFYRYAIGRGYANASPLPTEIPKRPESLVPYIYTTEELRQLLTATDILQRRKRHVQAMTFRTLLLVLYGTGVRISEALSLTLADVDLQAGLISVRESKFFKTRLVPIGPRLTDTLHAYANKRRHWPHPAGEKSAFFVTQSGAAIKCRWVDATFRMLCDRAGIHREDGGRYQPRIHDIRHASAVHRLVAWYREGGDVHRLLPLLSTYLGHRDLAATQRYLTMTPDLLQEANNRFERYIMSEVNHV